MEAETLIFRKAAASDLDAVTAIYDRIHAQEDAGRVTIGWVTGVYPTRFDAEQALARNDLYVCEAEGCVAASGILNQKQVDIYAEGRWAYPAEDSAVFVLHTLTVDPDLSGRGIGRAFVHFYEDTARKSGCTVLRMDTNEKNAAARRLYAQLGYREADIVPCAFNSIPNVRLVLLEKSIGLPHAKRPDFHGTM